MMKTPYRQRLTKFLPVFFSVSTIQTGCMHIPAQTNTMPDDFVYISDMIPQAQLDIRYYSDNNFVGTRIEGYEAPVAILSKPAAIALKNAHDAFRARGYTIRIFDAYRPQAAANHFVRWTSNLSDIKTKFAYYPRLEKKDLFPQGYIAARSSHSRGSTVDLTLIDNKTGREVDMGSSYDFFDPLSHHGATQLTPEQIAHREILKSVMQANGFKAYPWEWWHYTLESEPYPDHYFDFPVR